MESIKKSLDMRSVLLQELSKKIWDYSEVRFETPKSAIALKAFLRSEGFTIESPIADMDHAFIASYGTGETHIGLLAEYDALENMSQCAQSYQPKPCENKTAGHGCGHNLLGVGSVAAALAVKDYLKENPHLGKVSVFGAPAEESGYGKAFMARAGCFNDLDIALTWHPYDLTAVWGERTLAVYQVYFKFNGKSAHASAAPELGRSALDAAELMNIGVNFLREHMDDVARVHYAFVNAGGNAANVVQSEAALHYFIRHETTEKVDELYERVKKIAQGAALMTETELEIIWDSACADYLANKKLSELMYHHAQNIESAFDRQDYKHAKKYLTKTIEPSFLDRLARYYPNKSYDELLTLAQTPINETIADFKIWDRGYASTDVGDVSWNVPTAQMFVTCEPHGTPMHSWQWVDNGTSAFAHKGMMRAAQIMAATAIDVLKNPALLLQIQEEFKVKTKGKPYQSAIPKDVLPKQSL